MKNTIRSFTFLFSLVLIWNNVLAQSVKVGLPVTKYFNRREYGGATQNWKVAQGPGDLMYFANNDGLIEYDGESWLLHKNMGSHIVRCTKSIQGRVYAGSYNEFGYFKYNDSLKFTYVSLKKPAKSDFGIVWDIHPHNDYVIFHTEKGLCYYKNDEYEYFVPAPSRFIRSFLVNGLLFVYDEEKGLMQVRGKSAYQLLEAGVLEGKVVSAMLRKSDSEIIIGTLAGGLFLWNMQSIKPWDAPCNELLKKTNIYCALTYKDEKLVFGTIQSGMVIADFNGKVELMLDKNRGLKNNTVLSLCVDNEGNLWSGLDNGIVHVSFNSNITFLQGYYNLGTGYDVKIYDGNYYLASNQGLFRIGEQRFADALKNEHSFFKVEGTSGQVWDLHPTKNGLLCGHNLGVFLINGLKSTLVTPKGGQGCWVFREFPNSTKLMLVGTYDGLLVLKHENNRWQYSHKIEGFKESARFIEWDHDGNIWVSNGYLGVFRLRLSDNLKEIEDVTKYTWDMFPGNHSALVLTKINGTNLFTGRDGIFEIGYKGSPVKYDVFDKYFEKGNFPDKMVGDVNNDIWYFYPGRVGVLRRLDDGTYKKISKPFMQLKNNLVNGFEYVWADAHGNSFFGVENGFAHYLSGDTKDYNKLFKVHMRLFKSTGDSIEYLYNPEVGKQKVIPHFSFAKNSFEVQFAAPFFEGQHVEYATFMTHVDNEPTEWRNTTRRQFTKLKEGEYTFKVKAKNDYGIETSWQQINFVVLPPWYRSLVARGIYIVFLIITVVLVYQMINKKLEKDQEKEKLRQQEQFREKEEALKRENLIAEKEVIRLRNEKLRSEMVHKEKELANSTMSIIQKNDFLVNIKTNLNKIKSAADLKEVAQNINAVVKRIDRDLDSDSYWEIFETHLENVHEDFLKRLMAAHPELNLREQKLCAYIKMGMSSKEIASLMNITSKAVDNNRSRLRQKLGLETSQNITIYINQL